MKLTEGLHSGQLTVDGNGNLCLHNIVFPTDTKFMTLRNVGNNVNASLPYFSIKRISLQIL